ncbi:hypothetical protein RintRC_1872 [Richelia intracellularis]|nr:hypothetical protein RintRC_1872 [Richelia intracellularis]
MNPMTPKSGLFLACSCITAIAAVGSIFEITSGQPDLGVQNTAIILGLSIPLSAVFFLAAVRDTKANMK